MFSSGSTSYKEILFMFLCLMTISSSSLVKSEQRRSQRQAGSGSYGTNTGFTTATGKVSSYPANSLDSISPTAFLPDNPANKPYNNYPINYGGTGRFQNDVNQYGQGFYGGYDLISNPRRNIGGYGSSRGSTWRGFGGGRYPYGARSYPKSQQGVKY